MKLIIKKPITSVMLVLIGLNNYIYAESEPNLPQSNQIAQESKNGSSVQIVPEITIQMEKNGQNKNPKLKEGEACDDASLKPAELGPDDYSDIPMAETIPCDTVNCENLKPARLMRDSYKKIPMAETTKLKPCAQEK